MEEAKLQTGVFGLAKPSAFSLHLTGGGKKKKGDGGTLLQEDVERQCRAVQG